MPVLPGPLVHLHLRFCPLPTVPFLSIAYLSVLIHCPPSRSCALPALPFFFPYSSFCIVPTARPTRPSPFLWPRHVLMPSASLCRCNVVHSQSKQTGFHPVSPIGNEPPYPGGEKTLLSLMAENRCGELPANLRHSRIAPDQVFFHSPLADGEEERFCNGLYQTAHPSFFLENQGRARESVLYAAYSCQTSTSGRRRSRFLYTAI